MKLVTLKKEEFKKFAENHPQANFYQTIEWGELKEENNWQMVLLGLKDNEEIKAGCLLLSKDTPIKKKMFYSPRGFLIDYQDKELLKEFTEKIKDYVKKSKGIFIKIDPYLSYQQRDLEGNIVEVTKKSTGLFSAQGEVKIINTDTQTETVYMVENIPNSLKTYGDVIAINIGTEVHFIHTNGWLIKKYNSSQEIRDIVLSKNIAGIIYKDRIEIVNL